MDEKNSRWKSVGGERDLSTRRKGRELPREMCQRAFWTFIVRNFLLILWDMIFRPSIVGKWIAPISMDNWRYY